MTDFMPMLSLLLAIRCGGIGDIHGIGIGGLRGIIVTMLRIGGGD